MTANSNLLLFLVTLHSILSSGYCTASTTLLITGHSTDNNYKYAFAQKFVSQVELDRAHSADFLAISSDPSDAASEEEGVVLRTIGGIHLSGNLSQVVISRLGSNEMSLEHIQLLFKYIDTDQPLIVVEIGSCLGEQSVQTKSLLNKGALCWGEARANILSPNKAYICNDVPQETVRKVVDFQSLRGLVDTEKDVWVESQPRQFWPCFFASAAKAEKKAKRRQEIVEVDEDVEDIVDQIMKDIKQTEPVQKKKEEPVIDQKVFCRYRKSCYESGERPEIEASEHHWLDVNSLTSWFSSGDKKEDDDAEDEDENEEIDEDEDITPLKLKCKYRLNCYKEKGIKLSGKDEEREARKSLLAGKATVQTGKKRTLKDIAEKTISKVKVAEEKAANRPLPKAIVAERRMNEMEDKMNEKLQCKYRKSCYETGEPPVIAGAWVMPTFSTHAAKEAVEEVDFEEMEDLEKKLFCKYRKSCYSTGVKPDIEPDIQIHSFQDLKELPDVIETRKMTLQEKCKYRKSCYETGIVPEINPQLDKVIEKEVSGVIPSNVDDLRKFCKYRKSCYEEIANSASVETVKNIRKRRLIEREVRRRKVRRARIRRRLRGDVELDSIRHPVRRKHITATDGEKMKKHRVRKYVVETKEAENASEEVVQEQLTPEEMEPEVHEEEQEETPEPEPEPEQPKVAKRGRRKAKEVVEEVAEAIVEEVVPVVTRQRKGKKAKVEEPEEKVEEEEAVVERIRSKGRKPKEPEPQKEEEEEVQEEEPVVEKVKRGKRAKQPEPEPEPVEEEEPKAQPVRGKKEKIVEKEEEEETKTVVPKKKGKKTAPPPPPVEESEEEKKEEEEEPAVKVVVSPRKEEKEEKHHKKPHHDEAYFKKLQALQMHCKYRKSCYETKERPVIHQTLSTLFATFDSHVNEHYDRLERQELSETGRKLACKYRKSCYESGELPEIKERSTVVVVEPKKEPKHHKEQLKKVHTPPPKKEEKEEEEEEESKEEDSKEEKGEKDYSHMEIRKKLECKYRKSCYSSARPTISATRTVVSPSGSVEHKKCNEYYLSCREQLGLPPKEKAPMGPNGRRLCRKKKTDQ